MVSGAPRGAIQSGSKPLFYNGLRRTLDGTTIATFPTQRVKRSWEAFLPRFLKVAFAVVMLSTLTVVSTGAVAGEQDRDHGDKKPPSSDPNARNDKADSKAKAAPATKTIAVDTAAAPVQPPIGYRVGLDDELTISVWHEPEFSQGVVVRPDGMITMPLLNDIKVVGLTTEELQAILTEKLKTFVNEPQVTVIVRNIKSLRVSLVGYVGRQGIYPLTGGLTVVDLLAESGGLSPFAKSGSIYILRNVGGKQMRIGFNYKKALKGNGDNPILQSGDVVVVP
jgi:polysaccharide export outer membrane protein